MNWFLIALIPPLLYATGNYIDKAILSKHLRGGGIGTIIIFSCFLGALTLPIIYLIEPGVFSISSTTALILMINGGLTVLAVLSYLYAIEHDDISAVVPILQLTPVFGFIIGYLLLGETLTRNQIIGSAIVLLGALIISLEINELGKVRLKKKVLAMAAISALLFSLSGAVFKFFALDGGYWKTQFWEYVGIAVLGLLFFFFVKQYRHSFLSAFKENRKAIIGLNIGAEITMVSADLVMNYATLLAPVALIYVVNSSQPVFVFIIGIIATLLFPKVIKESMSKKHLLQKLLTILTIVLGLLILYW